MSSEKTGKQDDLVLKVDAHVVRQLGEELITDPEQAILELIKNSHDADADWCKIEIDNTHVETTEGGEKLIGKITIKDNGTGMSRDEINSGWLTISHSNKRALKLKGLKTKKERNYTGDKGLGRLGSMKLADVIRIKTYNTEGAQGLSVSFNWNDFVSGKTVDAVKVKESVLPTQEKTGTTIELLGIKNINYWSGQQNHALLQAKLSSLLSPFGHLINFKTFLTIDGVEVQIKQFEDELKDQSIAKFSFKLAEKKLFCEGYVKLNFYIGNKTEDKSDFKRFIQPDDGLSLFHQLQKQKNLGEYSLSILADNSFRFKFTNEILWSDITSSKECAYPGDFEAEIYYYFMDKGNIDFQDLSYEDSKSLIQSLIGVSAFRDGFRVSDGGNNDWLNFSESKRSGEGFYSIRSANSIGYISLSADKNAGIVEKSDREGFVENPQYNGLIASTQSMLSFINGFLNRSRRTSIKLLKEKREKELNKPENYSAEDAIVEIKALTSNASKQKKVLEKKSQNTAKAIEKAKSSINIALTDLILDQKSRNEIEELERQISEVASEIQGYSDASEVILSSLANHEYSAQKIIERMDSFNEQLSDFHDHVAIGLSAQGVAHEIFPQLDNININAKNIKKRIQTLELKDREVFRSLLAIEADTKIISQNVSILNPMLRNQRAIRENLNVCDALNEYIKFREARFAKSKIIIDIQGDEKPLFIYYNRGKLSQIIDNLFRNSIYWLDHQSKHDDFQKEIHIQFKNGAFVFWDNGPGIREGVEDIIFDMFISDKPKEQGQGLGLYIVRTLLKNINCTIDLLPERNKQGRKFKFLIDFEGALISG